MSKNRIADGYTRSYRIKGAERIYDQMDFDARPFTASQVAELDHQCKGGGGDMRLISRAVAKQLMSWSETDDNGEPAQINADNVHRLGYSLVNIMHKMIGGLLPSDLMDGPLEGQPDEDAAMDAIYSDGNAESIMESDRKNS